MLAPGPHLRDCVRLESRACDAEGFGTWIPIGSEMVILLRTPQHTLVYAPSIDCAFFAAPAFLISCPAHTALMGQFLVEHGMPRILVFDALRIANTDLRGTDPALRYAQIDHAWFAGGTVVKQWCGDAQALKGAIASGEFSPPHPIRCLAILGPNPEQVGEAQAPPR